VIEAKLIETAINPTSVKRNDWSGTLEGNISASAKHSGHTIVQARNSAILPPAGSPRAGDRSGTPRSRQFSAAVFRTWAEGDGKLRLGILPGLAS